MTNEPFSRKVAVTTDLDWPLRRHYDFLEGVQEYADVHEWELAVDPRPERRMRRGVTFDGIVGRIEQPTYEAAKARNIPMVNLWMHSPVRTFLPNVEVDYFAGANIAAQHLVHRGFRRLAYMGDSNQRHFQTQSDGVAAVAAERLLPFQARPIDALDHHSHEDWEATADMLFEFFENAETPMGLVVMTDIMARVVATIAEDAGLRVPEDLAIVSNGNDRIAAAAVHPSISSVDQGYAQNGFEAARILDMLMRGEEIPSYVLRLPPKQLVVRASSDAFVVRDPIVSQALSYMASNCTYAIGVNDVVNNVPLGRNALERRFRKVTGKTINQELVRLRVEVAKRLLVESDQPVSTIYADAGFGTLSNMYRSFHKVVGSTPAEYRMQHGQS
jgi:LacI family transcriptional regulator